MIKNLVSLLLSIFILLTGCSGTSSAVVTPKASITPRPVTTATRTPLPSDTPFPTPSPTETLTPTPAVPVFDPAALGDNRVLDSFILTIKSKTTGGGEVLEYKDIIGYVKEPFSAYHVGTTPYGNLDPKYLIGGRFYEKNSNQHYWNVSLEPDPTDVDFWLQSPADMREGYVRGGDLGPLSAQFVGQEDFQGIPANHFTFDQTNLRGYADAAPGNGGYKIKQAQGDLYLAQDGNYPLHFHVKVSGDVYVAGGTDQYSAGTVEITKDLSSINQLKEITLPADYLALKLELDLGLPVPAGTRLHAINHLEGNGYDLYDYFMPATVSKDDFLAFYRGLAPTNDWTVSQVGGKTSYDYCQNQNCVILTKGNAKAILFISDLCVSNIPANYICFDALYYR